jgi:septal ring factor EnvC (AmiA/AmiB activator)
VLTLAAGIGGAEVPEPAPEQAAREAELGALHERVEVLRTRQGETRSARDQLQEKLEAIEVAAGRVASELSELDRSLAAGESRLAALREDRAREERALAARRAALAGQVRSAYLLGRRGYLALLLDQEDPERLSRALAYHRHVQGAYAEQIRAVQAQIAAVAAVEQEIARHQAALASQRQERVRVQTELEQQRQTRAEVLARLQAELLETGTEIERLTEDGRRLEQIIETLRHGLAETAEGLEPERPFADMKGALPWPVAGRVRTRFGSPRPGGLAYQGVVIAARRGTPVQAVHHGRVAFADWLRGFGLLIIVDHGEGFMSLYGQNQELLRRVGDWVRVGEPLATVGDTGGSREAGLYFEVRQKGVAVDPARWCRATPSRG